MKSQQDPKGQTGALAKATPGVFSVSELPDTPLAVGVRRDDSDV